MIESIEQEAPRVTLKEAIKSVMFQCMDCGDVVIPAIEEGIKICPKCGGFEAGFEEIPGEQAIEYIVARLRRMKGAAEGSKAQYQIVLESLKKHMERTERQMNGFIAWSRPVLEAYYKAHVQAKKKSIDIGGTTIGYRSSAAGLELVEGAGATKGSSEELSTLHETLRWAKEHAPEFVKTEVSLKWGELKKWISSQEKPVEVPGVTLTKSVETFFVKV